MKKRPASLEALMAEPDLTGGTVIPFTAPRPGFEKLTVYVPKAAAKRLKQMALGHERRINDLEQYRKKWGLRAEYRWSRRATPRLDQSWRTRDASSGVDRRSSTCPYDEAR